MSDLSPCASPPVRRARTASAFAVLACVLALAGCTGVTQNPSRIGNLPNGNIIRTHAKPPLRGYWNDFDPHAKTLTVTPRTAINQVGTQHVIVASVCDDNGDGRRSRRVEWHVTGVGHIVEVDESGLFPGRGYMVDDKYAVSYTNFKRRTITRGNKDASDDIQLRPGQTYCVIYSPVEGETHVTCYAPGIYDWQKHKVTVTKIWVDAQPIFPPPAINRAGEPHTLTTRVVRTSDGSGASGYKVRYRLLDGPPAAFDPGGAPGVEVVTDPNGNGSVVLRQLQPTPGVNRIQIDVVRPSSSPTGREIVLSSHVTTKTWVAPQISVQKLAPAAAVVGGPLPFRITVMNTGSVATQGVTIRDTVPDTLNLVGSNPPATLQGNNLIWSFGPLQPSQALSVEFTCTPTQAGTVTNCAEAATPEGLLARSCSTTQIQQGGLTVSKTGPASALVGQPVTFQIIVTNPGTAPIADVRLVDQFDAGFAPLNGSNVAELPVGVVGPGESKVVPITLTPTTPGRLCNRITAEAAGGLSAAAEHCVEVHQPQLSISKSGPNVALVGANVDFVITVRNTGAIPAADVVVRDPLPAELQPIAAPGGAVQGQNALWSLGALVPGEERRLALTARAVAVGSNVCNSAVVAALGVPDQHSPPVCMQVRGVQAILTELIDRADPVPVGGETTYAIRITNQGSVPLTNVTLECVVPPEMEFVEAEYVDPRTGQRATTPPEYDARTRTVRFPPFSGLQGQPGMMPRKEITYQVQVRAVRPGDARFQTRVSADQIKTPIVDQESTQCYDPATGATNGSAGLRPSPTILAPVGSTSNYAPAEEGRSSSAVAVEILPIEPDPGSLSPAGDLTPVPSDLDDVHPATPEPVEEQPVALILPEA